METKFQRDLDFLLRKISSDVNQEIRLKLRSLRNKLVEYYQKRLVKINHSLMELICAKYLIQANYEVKVEQILENISCDIYAVKGLGSLIVEIETGFVPPEHALEPLTYSKARIASKITRYSSYSEKFSLAGPPHYIMQIPPALIKPPKDRTKKELQQLKKLCDMYYKNPPVSFEEIKNARLHTIFIIDVDNAQTTETDPYEYTRMMEQWHFK